MKDPAYTWNAVVVGEDMPCWSGTRRHGHLKACAAHAAARCCRHDSFANRPTSQGQRTACRSREPLSPTTISGCGTKIGAEHSLSWHRFPWIGSGADDRTELPPPPAACQRGSCPPRAFCHRAARNRSARRQRRRVLPAGPGPRPISQPPVEAGHILRAGVGNAGLGAQAVAEQRPGGH
jgi:hypothetical protein